MPSLHIHLLGEFRIELNGRPVNGFATDKVRALLAYLAVERERKHRRESLAALLWADQPYDASRQNLRQALYQIKQAFATDMFLQVTAQEVQLNPDADILVDVEEVLELFKTCEAHPHQSINRCLPCLRRFEVLLERYQGDFLKDFPPQNSDFFEDWLCLTREKLRNYALTAHVELANFAENRRDLKKALFHTLEQVKMEPWREQSHRQLMKLYAQRGERSKALAQYRVCAQIMEEEFSVSPTTETIDLFNRIANDEYRYEREVTHTLPNPFSSFIGRVAECEALSERISHPLCRLITICGMGGIGKSRLALQLVYEHIGLFDDGVFFIPLLGENQFFPAIATVLGFSDIGSIQQLALLMREKELLLVLDNCEHLIDQSEEISYLLEQVPKLKIIVTSRECLHLREEWVYSLDGLSYPVSADDENDHWDSLILFESRATQVDQSFRLTPANSAEVKKICQFIDGHPLAIELAASTVSKRSCVEIAAEISKDYAALAPTLRNFPPRHRSMRAVFEHSWKLLSEAEQECLTQLSVFAGSWSKLAANEVAGAELEILCQLVDKSLVRRSAEGRFSLHENIRQFAAEKLQNTYAVQEAHCRYYSKFSRQSKDTSMALSMLQFERANLRVAWEWALKYQPNNLEDLLHGLVLLYSLQGPVSEGEQLFRLAYRKICAKVKNKNHAELQTISAMLAIELARLLTIQHHYRKAITLLDTVSGEPPIVAKAMLFKGQALSAQGKCKDAQPVLLSALAIAEKNKDYQIEADCLRELGNTANRLADFAAAEEWYQRSLSLSRQIGDKRGESACLNNCALIQWELGDIKSAEEGFLNALDLYRELGSRLGEAKALNNLANAAADRGDYSASLQYLKQALQIHTEMGNPRGQSAVLNNIGATYFSLCQYDSAKYAYRQALKIHIDSGNYQAQGETLANLSLLECVQGNLDNGRQYAVRAIELAQKMGDPVTLANATYYLGRIELSDGKLDKAEIILQRAFSLRSKVAHPGRLAEIQIELAFVAYKRGEVELALKRIEPVMNAINDSSLLDGTDDPEHIREIVFILTGKK